METPTPPPPIHSKFWRELPQTTGLTHVLGEDHLTNDRRTRFYLKDVVRKSRWIVQRWLT